MTDKLQFFSTEVFFERPFIQPSGQQLTQMTVLLPMDAISYVIQKEKGNPHSGYEVHFKKTYFHTEPFTVKSINPVHLTADKVELIK